MGRFVGQRASIIWNDFLLQQTNTKSWNGLWKKGECRERESFVCACINTDEIVQSGHRATRYYHLTVHFATAACTNFDMSSFACFFALSVIPSSLSSAPGEVSSGSNSSR